MPNLHRSNLFDLTARMQDIPLTDAAIVEMARALLDLDIPAECLPGVRTNLEILAGHARLVEQPDD